MFSAIVVLCINDNMANTWMLWSYKYFKYCTCVNIYESVFVTEEAVKKGILSQMKEMKRILCHE